MDYIIVLLHRLKVVAYLSHNLFKPFVRYYQKILETKKAQRVIVRVFLDIPETGTS